MIESPLEIKKIHPGNIRIYPAPDDAKTSNDCTLRTKYGWGSHAEDPQSYRVKLVVSFGKVKKDHTPEHYRGEVEMIGYFKIHPDYPSQHAETLIGVTAISVLYGAARELISSLTSRHPYGTLSIPSVSFIDEATPKKQSLNT